MCSADVLGGGAAGDPADEGGEPDVADHPGDRDVLVGELVGSPGCMARVSIEVSSMPTWWISLCDRGVGEHERPGERLGEVRVALEAAGGLAEHVA